MVKFHFEANKNIPKINDKNLHDIEVKCKYRVNKRSWSTESHSEFTKPDCSSVNRSCAVVSGRAVVHVSQDLIENKPLQLLLFFFPSSD